MIRDRVGINGIVRPMEAESEIPALNLSPEEIGIVNEVYHSYHFPYDHYMMLTLITLKKTENCKEILARCSNVEQKIFTSDETN